MSVRAVITLDRALGKTVIAEGIETPAQLERLRAMCCELGQGYLLARPLTPEVVAEVAPDSDRWAARLPRFSESSTVDLVASEWLATAY